MAKKVSESKTEQVYIVGPSQINGFGRLFGGQLLQWIDELAGIVCIRHSGMRVTTASIDNLNFIDAAYLNDIVTLVGKLTYVGRTSMEVRVDTFAEDKQGTRKCINCAYIVLVAVDQEGNPVQVPKLEIETEQEKLEWQKAEKRCQLRKRRRNEGY